MESTKIDRRIIRSKMMLKNALRELLVHKKFINITVQEVSELSTINRATFYKHYIDKHALLEGVLQDDFQKSMDARTQDMKGADKELLRQLILAVADFILPISRLHLDDHNTFIPLMQKTVQKIISTRLLVAVTEDEHVPNNLLRKRVKSAMTAWAIYAAVSQWAEMTLDKKIKIKNSSIESLIDMVLDPITGLTQ